MPFCLGQAVHRASTQSQYTEPALDLALLNGENFIAAYINEIVSYNMNVVRIFSAWHPFCLSSLYAGLLEPSFPKAARPLLFS